MKLYNTLTKTLEEFEPIDSRVVSMYSCGPTVYSYYHIGNLRNAVFNDTLRRALECSGYEVKQVMNITDVGHLTSDADEGEDKLEKGARDSGKTVWDVAEFYAEAFKNDMSAIGVIPPNGYSGSKDNYARATDFIDEQIKLIELLLNKGFAYQSEQAIYFDVAKLEDYGELSGQKLNDKEIAARSDVVVDTNKHSPQDFALWFFATGHFSDHSMKWPSPWGDGFPGWHLECSAIIHATLGDPIDIHTGGIDHVGTHHPNEMAQTKAAFGHRLANYWIHNEFVLVNGEKMSKSKGNAYTLAEVVAKGYSPLALRYLYLQAHYRSELNFTWESLDSAQAGLLGIWAWADLMYQTSQYPPMSQTQVEDFDKKLQNLIGDDLNTAAALALYSQVADEFGPSNDLLVLLDKYFGLSLSNRADISEAQKVLIKQRQKARDDEDWGLSDQIRDVLQQEHGLLISDTSKGPIWSRLR